MYPLLPRRGAASRYLTTNARRSNLSPVEMAWGSFEGTLRVRIAGPCSATLPVDPSDSSPDTAQPAAPATADSPRTTIVFRLKRSGTARCYKAACPMTPVERRYKRRTARNDVA